MENGNAASIKQHKLRCAFLPVNAEETHDAVNDVVKVFIIIIIIIIMNEIMTGKKHDGMNYLCEPCYTCIYIAC